MRVMKSKKFLAAAMVAGVGLGGLSLASVASAQSYGGDPGSATVEESVDAETNAGVVDVQDADAETNERSERGERGRRGHRGGGCNLEAAAEAIGIDETELRDALDGGESIADVAEANGVSVDAVIDALVEDKAEQIAEKVESGRITQDEADQKLADAEDKITDRVNGVERDADDSEDTADA